MTTRPTRQNAKRLTVQWAPEAGFPLTPKVVRVGRKRRLKVCTIAISTGKPPASPPAIAPHSQAA